MGLMRVVQQLFDILLGCFWLAFKEPLGRDPQDGGH